MGCVGNDKYAKILGDKARANGLNVHYQYTDKETTGTCAVLITGTERSLCANLAAANCFSISHIQVPENRLLLDKAEFIYVSVSIIVRRDRILDILVPLSREPIEILKGNNFHNLDFIEKESNNQKLRITDFILW